MIVMSENIVLSWALTFTCFFSAIAHPGDPGLEVGSQTWWNGYEDSGQTYLATEQINMTAILGHTVTLPCRVINLRDKRVSWIRSRDLLILTVDRLTISTDARISLQHPEETEDWLLEIRGVAQSDEGTYECQVNTHPKMSTKVHMKVIPERGLISLLDLPVSDTGVITDSKASSSTEKSSNLRVRVIGRRWVRVAEGSTLRLVCEAAGKELQDPQKYPPHGNDPLISWTLDGIPVTSLWPQSKVMVRESWRGHSVESEVEVSQLHTSDSGTFACIVPDVEPDRVSVTVSDSRHVNAQAKLASPEASDDSQATNAENNNLVMAGAAGRAAVISGAIILFLLIVQAALCVFYIKKV